jgi:hypothetical protein
MSNEKYKVTLTEDEKKYSLKLSVMGNTAPANANAHRRYCSLKTIPMI